MKVPVVIVGAGPTGLTAAALLGRHGVESLVPRCRGFRASCDWPRAPLGPGGPNHLQDQPTAPASRG
ncbi:FAD-dependent monooxygenase [Streptomyces spongiae]|uniref:FAD-dependent monooxygenase n=1 Tax=Streptomyces spongiae TaxID=565072 RepID=UPI002AD29E95|nr:FAD-dependent monooxygenase [Streptomyces spongiae]